MVRRVHVVAKELFANQAPDLGLKHYDRVCVLKMAVPIPRFRQIRIFGLNAGVHVPQRLQVADMLVKYDDVFVSALAQPCD
jgi:hypothetical protein